MAFVTSVIHTTPDGRRIRVLHCYAHVAETDDASCSHTVQYGYPKGERALHVSEIWEKHGWGRRGKQLPICPAHRIATDADWPKENP